MRKILLPFITVIVISSCSSLNKKLQREQYDAAIERTVKRLIKDPSNAEDVRVLDKAYKTANERDLERIKFLKLENNPNNYDEIFQRYDLLKARQSRVRVVLPLNLKGTVINYDQIDYDYEIVEAKKKAADYYYTNGKRLLENRDRTSNREAYYQLARARDYSGDGFPDLIMLLNEARFKGTTKALVQVANNSRLSISPEFEEELLNIDTQGLNSEWVEYHFRHVNDDIDYDYMVVINIQDILLTPNQSKSKDVNYKREVENGFKYALDARGNVMKDTAGNDIKIPLYKTLSATLIETQQYKEVTIKGVVEFMEMRPVLKLITKEPVGANNIFNNVSARAVGDLEALDDEAKIKIEKPIIPFPSDFQMIYNCAETLKPAIRNAIYANRQRIF